MRRKPLSVVIGGVLVARMGPRRGRRWRSRRGLPRFMASRPRPPSGDFDHTVAGIGMIICGFGMSVALQNVTYLFTPNGRSALSTTNRQACVPGMVTSDIDITTRRYLQ